MILRSHLFIPIDGKSSLPSVHLPSLQNALLAQFLRIFCICLLYTYITEPNIQVYAHLKLADTPSKLIKSCEENCVVKCQKDMIDTLLSLALKVACIKSVSQPPVPFISPSDQRSQTQSQRILFLVPYRVCFQGSQICWIDQHCNPRKGLRHLCHTEKSPRQTHRPILSQPHP